MSFYFYQAYLVSWSEQINAVVKGKRFKNKHIQKVSEKNSNSVRFLLNIPNITLPRSVFTKFGDSFDDLRRFYPRATSRVYKNVQRWSQDPYFPFSS